MTRSGDHDLFREIVENNGSFVLTTHMNPDGDAIGSEIGLARFLIGRGKQVRIINQDPTPYALGFLERDTMEAEVYDPTTHDGILGSVDRIVLLDNSAPDRLGRLEAVMRQAADRVLCIDHHPTSGTPWNDNILDEESCATAAIVYDLLVRSGAELDLRTAEALFAGIATDTGFFRFNSTTPRAYEIAGELMRAGARPAQCFRQVYERNSAAYTRLLGLALSDLRLDADGAVASIRIQQSMVDATQTGDEDTSEMTTALLAIDGVRIAILFRETDDNHVKVSLRSKGSLDVRVLATEFGGGGHRNASGIVMQGHFDEVIERVLERATTLAGSGSGSAL